MPDLLHTHLNAVKRACAEPDVAAPHGPIAASSFHLWALFGAAVDSTRYEAEARSGVTVMHEGKGGKSIARVQIRRASCRERV